MSKSEIDFVIEEKYNLHTIIGVKYKSKVKIPLAFKNFKEKYNVDKQIIITKETLKLKNDVYYIPACLLSFVNI